MIKILIARSIFCPNLEHLNISINNLINLFLKLQFQKQDIDNPRQYTLYVCGWSKSEYINKIKNAIDIITSIFNEVIIDIWPINYGKYKVLENIVEKCIDYDKVFYSDHDIIFKHQNDTLFNHLDDVLGYSVNKLYKVGIVMLNQSEDIRHQYDIYENEFEYKGIKYVYPTLGNFSSIASGCFYINSRIFSNIKFDVIHVYGLDDYYIIKKLYEKFLIAVVTKNLYVTHPFNKNTLFNEWKLENVKKCINNIDCNSNNNEYYSNIEQSMNLWI